MVGSSILKTPRHFAASPDSRVPTVAGIEHRNDGQEHRSGELAESQSVNSKSNVLLPDMTIASRPEFTGVEYFLGINEGPGFI